MREVGVVCVRVISKTRIKIRNTLRIGLFVLPDTVSIVVLRHRRLQVSSLPPITALIGTNPGQ